MNLRLIRVLLLKEIKDLIWNGQVAILFVTSILMILVFFTFNQLEFNLPGHSITMFKGIPTTLSFIVLLVTMYVQGNLMVEEKEQNTERLLGLIKVKYINVFISKAIVTYILSYLLFVLAMVIHGYSFENFITASFFTIPFFLMFLFLGTIIAEASSNTIEVSLYGWPIFIVYFVIEGLIYSSIESRFFYLFPNYHIERGFSLIEHGEFLAVFNYIYVPIIWMFIILFFLKKRRKNSKTILNSGFS
ncbi:hypothetical protein [Cytobacillus purgationiresistens]|uniref:ABC-2 type transport system permease protein n=1 Tax=Cytobacillus purgationiresistens TaxID=863449 RepID=A0ABU0AQW6_9BACI|nr:hypothetical protein [Cytobacillus purgationiresistens]MDQ0273676.1 ABC-2 type transport system permease protein [Cytobacillus purgationiresistens]